MTGAEQQATSSGSRSGWRRGRRLIAAWAARQRACVGRGLGQARGLAAVVALQVASWVRRGWRRAWHSLRRSSGHAPALAAALVLVLVLRARPVLRSGVGSPVWGQCAAELAERVLGWKLYLGVAALAVLGWLVGLASLFGLALAFPAPTLVLFFAGRTGYRHTVYARVRARYGVDGWADFWELHRGLSAHAVREVASHHRPSLTTGLPVPDRRRDGTVAVAAAHARRSALIEQLPVSQCGTWMGRSAVGPWWGVQLYAALRDVVGLIAPPQTGKTALMIHHIIDAAGAVLATSTKPEIYQLTAALRAAICGPGEIALFNPDNLGGLGSTLRWCPVRGCASYRYAATRAGLLVGARTRRDDSDTCWDEWATNVLTGLLMVADLDGLSMTDVARWVHNPTDPKRGAHEALRLMRGTYRRQVPPEVADALGQVLGLKADKTRDSVFFAMRGSVSFMADSSIAWLCTPARDEAMFDVERFLDRRGALYLLGSEEQNTGSAPLLAAFTGHVFATAKNLAARRGGRLDPPLSMILDEAALITPVPLPSWVSDAGGRGIHIEWSVQTPSQLRERWGEPGAETIINATNALLVFGGLKAEKDLNLASLWCGKRYELVPDPDGPDGDGRAKFDHVPVCPPELVRVIPQWHALLVHRTTKATVIKMWPGWKRDDVKRAGPPPTSTLPVVYHPDQQRDRHRPGPASTAPEQTSASIAEPLDPDEPDEPIARRAASGSTSWDGAAGSSSEADGQTTSTGRAPGLPALPPAVDDRPATGEAASSERPAGDLGAEPTDTATVDDVATGQGAEHDRSSPQTSATRDREGGGGSYDGAPGGAAPGTGAGWSTWLLAPRRATGEQSPGGQTAGGPSAAPEPT